MRSSLIRLTTLFAVALSLAGCDNPPPPAAATTKADKTLPEGITKTKKGVFKGRMTNDVRKSMGTAGLEE